jgi:hypothetical protein
MEISHFSSSNCPLATAAIMKSKLTFSHSRYVVKLHEQRDSFDKSRQIFKNCHHTYIRTLLSYYVTLTPEKFVSPQSCLLPITEN